MYMASLNIYSNKNVKTPVSYITSILYFRKSYIVPKKQATYDTTTAVCCDKYSIVLFFILSFICIFQILHCASLIDQK